MAIEVRIKSQSLHTVLPSLYSVSKCILSFRDDFVVQVHYMNFELFTQL